MKKFVVRHKDRAVSSGITFINVLILVAIATLILTMVIPTYSNFSIRVKTNKALSNAQTAKNSIEYACHKDPGLNYIYKQAIGYKFTATKYIYNIEFGGGCTAPIITITTHATGAQPDPVLTVFGELSSVPSNITWHCVSSGLNSYTPKACRS